MSLLDLLWAECGVAWALLIRASLAQGLAQALLIRVRYTARTRDPYMGGFGALQCSCNRFPIGKLSKGEARNGTKRNDAKASVRT
jgi:hypothetical protein